MVGLHESEKLNALLGKRVCAVLFDGGTYVGVLEKSAPPHIKGYAIGNVHFRKTHVKRITEV